MTFTMNTSGEVGPMPHGYDDPANLRGFWSFPRARYAWLDLSPFAQGYVETMFAEKPLYVFGGTTVDPATGIRHYRSAGFSDLAPETLAAILKDCEDETQDETQAGYDSHSQGRSFWLSRQAGCLAPHLRPVTPYLGDDGKVRLREVT